jgi:hypothetical protein
MKSIKKIDCRTLNIIKSSRQNYILPGIFLSSQSQNLMFIVAQGKRLISFER